MLVRCLQSSHNSLTLGLGITVVESVALCRTAWDNSGELQICNSPH